MTIAAEPTALLRVDEIEFVKELYPRLREDDAAIERYRAAIDKLPPIVVARGRILVDGFHRWQAHRREGLAEVRAEDLGDLSDAEILREAYTRNATHGHQLSESDKRSAACHLYSTLPGTADERYADIAQILSLTTSSAKKYAAEARQSERQRKQQMAWDLHLDCWTQQSIADEIGESQQTVANWVQKREADSEFCSPPASRQHFDVWSFQSSDGDSSYFGKMPPQVIENLLWLYTEPGQIVVDPFAGGGTTIDIAKAMGRRVWSSDLHPSTPTLPIHEHDVATGWPSSAPKRADFVLLDPPYWMQARGRYSDDERCFGNKTLNDFLQSWSHTVFACAEHLAEGGKLAYIVSAARDDERQVVDLAYAMYEPCVIAGLTPHRRIIVTYQTQQATGQQVEWARENRDLLVLYRDLVVFAK